MDREYSFFFHYNKPASAQHGSPVFTVHYRDTCYLVEHVECKVPVYTRVRSTQPRAVVAGKAKSLVYKESTHTVILS
jgi:hypothetical protein